MCQVSPIIACGAAGFSIASLFGTTVEAGAQSNNRTNAGQISVRQELLIPVP